MIYVRDDDVLLGSSSHDNPVKHFKTVHSWICETPKLLHVPAILVTEIQDFPEAIDFIREETAAGRMRPEIHGLKHIDYSKLSELEVRQQLKECQVFLHREFNVSPTIWYTPWGANAPHLESAAKAVGLKLVDCSNINKLSGRYGLVQLAREGKDIEKIMQDKDIFFHWWEGGLRLKRVVEILKLGSFDAAAAANKDWF